MQVHKQPLVLLLALLINCTYAARHCTDKLQLYAQGKGLLYSELEFCIQLSSITQLEMWVTEVQYKWGGAWYNPTRDSQWSASSQGYISGVGNYSTAIVLASKPSAIDSIVLPTNITGGKHTIGFEFSQTGPYWNEESIAYKGNLTITLPSKDNGTTSSESRPRIDLKY